MLVEVRAVFQVRDMFIGSTSLPHASCKSRGTLKSTKRRTEVLIERFLSRLEYRSNNAFEMPDVNLIHMQSRLRPLPPLPVP